MKIQAIASMAFIISGSIILLSVANGVLGDEVDVLLDDQFASTVTESNLNGYYYLGVSPRTAEIDPERWDITGDAIVGDEYVQTCSAEAHLSGLTSKESFKLPHADNGDREVLRLEWSVQVLRSGELHTPMDIYDYRGGAEMRVAGGREHGPHIPVQVPLVLYVVDGKAYLNTSHVFALEKTPDGWHHFVAEFTAEAVLSLAIDGRDVLDRPAPAYKVGPAAMVNIRFGDYEATNSSSRFGPVRLSRVTRDDELTWRLDTFDVRNVRRADTPSEMIVSVASPMRKVMRDLWQNRLAPSRTFEMSAAGDERESFQIVVMPTSGSLNHARLEMSDLVMDSGERIAAERLSWNVVGYLRTGDVYTSGPAVGSLWPDPLMPGEPTDIVAGFAQPFWVTVHVPPGTEAGIYRGLVTIQAEGVDPVEVRLVLRVLGFDLPKTSSMHTAFAFCPQTWVLWYHADELTQQLPEPELRGPLEHVFNINREMMDLVPREKWDQVYDLLLSHRISPSYFYQPIDGPDTPLWPFPEDWQQLADKGMNTLALANVNVDWKQIAWGANRRYRGDKAKYVADLQAHLDKWVPVAKELDWEGLAYVYGFDESDLWPNSEAQFDPAITELFGMIGERYPGLSRASANGFNANHDGLFDIWVPVTYQMDAAQRAERQGNGDEVWTYVCGGPGRPMANFLIDYPAIDGRVLLWQMKDIDVSGLLYWATNYYVGQTNWNQMGVRWPRSEWLCNQAANGDGLLIYPGPDMTPLSSIRLENIRDGIEDYDYLAMLEHLALEADDTAATALARSIEDVAGTLAQPVRDPQKLLDRREKIGQAIERLIARQEGASE